MIALEEKTRRKEFLGNTCSKKAKLWNTNETLEFRISGAGFYRLVFLVSGMSKLTPCRIYLCLSTCAPTALCGREVTSSQAVATAFRVPCNLGHASCKSSSSFRDLPSHSEVPQLHSLWWWWWKSHCLHFSSLCMQVRQGWNCTAPRKDAFVILWLVLSSLLFQVFLLRKASFVIPLCSLSQVVALKVRCNSRAVVLVCLTLIYEKYLVSI